MQKETQRPPSTTMSSKTNSSVVIMDTKRLDDLLGKPPPVPKGKPFREQKEHLRKSLQAKLHHRVPSLSPAEQFFLHALLVDGESEEKPEQQAPQEEPKESTPLLSHQSEEQQIKSLEQAAKVLDDEVLFSVPDDLANHREHSETGHASSPKAGPLSPQTRRKSKIHGLWQAYEDGVQPKSLAMRSSQSMNSLDFSLSSSRGIDQEGRKSADGSSLARDVSRGDSIDVRSDVELRADDSSEGSSWGDSSIERHYNAWEILKDEYAKDFGFDYSRNETVADVFNGSGSDQHTFKILGTSADDASAQPHVLSPPLMDSLMSFLPEKLVNQNYWLKFSLARDGASLETLKQYARASPDTILAIETDKGDVFGCYTSQSWRNHFGFYGGSPAFVWKMRHSRRTKCYSLFDQAQLESEVDVFMSTSEGGPDGQLLQVCRHDALAIGGDDAATELDDFADFHEVIRAAERMGFALALEDDLMVGTTSPSPSFSSPSLCGPGDKTESFNVSNMEIWSFTPCFDVSSAEKLEMSKFFIEESSHRFSDPPASSTPSSQFSSRDFDQEKFYRRVGRDVEGDERRQRWQYLNMMHGPDQRSGGINSTPRFGYSS